MRRPTEVAVGSGRRATRLLLPAAFSLVPLLAACGSGGGTAATGDTAPSESSSTTAGSQSGNDGADDFAACLAEQGVELPSGAGTGGPPAFGDGGPPTDAEGGTPPSPPEGVDADAMQQAMEACGDLAPQGGLFGGGDLSEEDQEAMRVYQSCLADNGVDLGGGPPGADGDGTVPDASDGTVPQGSFPSPDLDDPEVAAAFETCEPLQPEGFGGPIGGAPTDQGTTPDTGTEASS